MNEELLVAELQRLSKAVEALEHTVTNLRIELAVTKTKSGIFGAISGVITAGIYYFLKMGGKS